MKKILYIIFITRKMKGDEVSEIRFLLIIWFVDSMFFGQVRWTVFSGSVNIFRPKLKKLVH